MDSPARTPIREPFPSLDRRQYESIAGHGSNNEIRQSADLPGDGRRRSDTEPRLHLYDNDTGRRRRSSQSTSPDLEMSGLHHEEQRHEDEEEGFAKNSQPLLRRDRTLTLDNGVEIDLDDLRSLGNKAFLRKAIINGILISLWYFFSVSISVYNKWMFAGGQLDFHFPLFITSGHMLVQFGLASLVLFLVPSLRPRHDSLDPPPTPRSIGRHTATEHSRDSSKPLMPLSFYLTRIAPCAGATGLDIGLGNTSLRYVTLIFFTMCKSSTLGFVLLFAIIFGLEKASWKLAGIICIMTAGVIMMVAGETAFSALGFALLMMASFFSGLRWSLTQMLLRRNPATSNPFTSLFFLTPIMFAVLFLLAIPVEGFRPLRQGCIDLAAKKGTAFSIALLIFPGFLAFLMTSAEFALLKRTSVVTLSVCGIFKEVITIAAGGIIFDETLTPINISGLLVTVVAIALYNYIRMRKMKKKAVQDAQDEIAEQSPMLSTAASREEGFGHETGSRESAGDLIRRNIGVTTQKHPHISAKDNGAGSPLVKPPENLD